VGFPYFGFGTFPYELEAAITEKTAAIAYHAGGMKEVLSLPEVVDIAHAHDVPVIVDAAAELPPAGNLQRFISEGADLVAFSGGKAIRGPQASGFLCGRKDLIRSAAMQHQDMTLNIETWSYRNWMEDGTIAGPPHHGIGRGLKVGKEEIVGLIVALRRYVDRDHDSEMAEWQRQVTFVADALSGLKGVEVKLHEASNANAVPSTWIIPDKDIIGKDVYEVILALQEQNPPVCVNEDYSYQGSIVISPMALRKGEEVSVAERLTTVLK
jgi:L-seryl-tRNA(Ser) seleniumtransferase